MNQASWFRDRRAWRLIALGYLPALAVLMLAWEVAHAPLYTIWREAEPAYIAFSILHCALGDVMIGTAALFLALVSGLAGTAYTTFSEWMNIALLRSGRAPNRWRR